MCTVVAGGEGWGAAEGAGGPSGRQHERIQRGGGRVRDNSNSDDSGVGRVRAAGHHDVQRARRPAPAPGQALRRCASCPVAGPCYHLLPTLL